MKKENLKSFNFKNLKIKVYNEVYDPSEDSFLLLESIDYKKNDLIFEIGTGCGIISLYLCMNNINVVCSDINPYAVKNTLENFKINKEKIKGNYDVRLGDMYSVLKEDENFNTIIFNPPYLPELKNSPIKDIWFNKAVEGGSDGLKYIEIFLSNVKKYLKENGKSFFVFSSHSDENRLIDLIEGNDLSFNIVNTLSFDSEKLKIFKLF